MAEHEGVIKYQLFHQNCDLPDALAIADINGWRQLLGRLGLIGEDPCRYGGLGFGNISRRLAPDSPAFLITGTQTGHRQRLQREDFAIVDDADPLRNRLSAHGPCQPSSEALTHASLYQRHAWIQAVIHVHSPELWRHAATLHLPHTAADIAYGTPQMASAVTTLLECPALAERKLFAMLGHEDGIVSFGSSLEQAGQVLLTQLAAALSLNNAHHDIAGAAVRK